MTKTGDEPFDVTNASTGKCGGSLVDVQITGQQTKAFVLSLRRDRARRCASIRRIIRSRLSFEVVDAMDATLTRSSALASGWGGAMSPAEVACYHSHISILERVVDYGLSFAVILEDDFREAESPAFALADLWGLIPKDADHIQLHAFGPRFNRDYKVAGERGCFDLVRPTSLLTIGYVVSYRLAKLMLSSYRFPRMPIDHQYVDLSRTDLALCFLSVRTPVIDIDEALPSTIRLSKNSRNFGF